MLRSSKSKLRALSFPASTTFTYDVVTGLLVVAFDRSIGIEQIDLSQIRVYATAAGKVGLQVVDVVTQTGPAELTLLISALPAAIESVTFLGGAGLTVPPVGYAVI